MTREQVEAISDSLDDDAIEWEEILAFLTRENDAPLSRAEDTARANVFSELEN
jgi:hypothetical protein